MTANRRSPRRVLADALNQAAPEVPGVAKNAWWYALCPVHGEQRHLGVLDGACERCQAERLG